MGKFWSGLRQKLGEWLLAIGISLMDESGDQIQRLLKRMDETLGLDDDEIHLIMELRDDGCLIIHSCIGNRQQAAKFKERLKGTIVLAHTFSELRGYIIDSAAFHAYDVAGKTKWVH